MRIALVLLWLSFALALIRAGFLIQWHNLNSISGFIFLAACLLVPVALYVGFIYYLSNASRRARWLFLVFVLVAVVPYPPRLGVAPLDLSVSSAHSWMLFSTCVLLFSPAAN